MSDPVFKSVFGPSWDSLPHVMKQHYANRPYSADRVRMQGHMDILCRAPLKWFAPIMELLKLMPPANEINVPVTVYFQSNPDQPSVQLLRTFKLKQGNFEFHTRMQAVQGNEVVEVMPWGLTWRTRITWENNTVILSHLGYALSIGKFRLPLPLTCMLGRGHAEEHPTGENSFSMFMHIEHPWWGKVYEYKGTFEVTP